MSRVALLTAGGRSIGLGHLARSRVMAHAALRAGIDVRVIIPTGTDATEMALGEIGFVAMAFSEATLGPPLQALDRDDAILIDLPDASLEQLSWLRRIDRLRIAFRMFGPPSSGAVEHVALTPAFHATRRTVGPLGKLPRLCLAGWEQIVLRPTVFASANDRRSDPPSVVITMGGSDPYRLTELACRELTDLGVPSQVIAVVGASNGRASAIREEFGQRLEIVDQRDCEFDTLLRQASVAVINGGLTRYECVAAQLPFVAIGIHQRQAAITELVTQCGYGLNLGVWDELPPGAIAASVVGLLTHREPRQALHEGTPHGINAAAPDQIVASIGDWQLFRDS